MGDVVYRQVLVYRSYSTALKEDEPEAALAAFKALVTAEPEKGDWYDSLSMR